ncbi:MAG: ABC transporter permease subunit [Ruminococcus sp.]|nr:ABC transporter permease subunit [Ruminococcus sp.]
MLSIPLLKQSMKSNAVMWGSMTGVMTLLCVQFSMLDMTRSLLFTIFYGMMTTILPGIYVLVTSNKLLASQVDRGSMAYVLSTPVKRSSVTFTQSFFLVNSLVLMFAIQTGAHLLVNHSKPVSMATLGYTMLSGDLTSKMILQVNLSALMVCIALAGVCFMFSGVFSSSKYTIGLSGAFVGVSILANMLAMFGNLGVNGLDKFKYLTVCSFYDYRSVLFANNDWIEKMIYPAVIAVVAFGLGQIVFKKKDLPL